MKLKQLIRINFPAGIVSPGTLLDLLDMLVSLKVTRVRFGGRQQLLIDIPLEKYEAFAAQCAGKNIPVSTHKHLAENIVSSYVAAGIFITDSWLREGVYKEVFDLFDYTPRLKININDSGQTFVPLFTGNINWIASPHLHFWYLYVRFPKTNELFRWPRLIYTNTICTLSKEIEKLVLSNKIMDSATLVESVNKTFTYISKPVEKELALPKFHLPYYEGFNTVGNQYWLGIYRRDEFFSVAFLKDLCTVCLQTKVSELYITSWKTIIIKGIEKNHRNLWDFVLGKHRINVRHAANELNWIVEDDNEDGLILKRHVIRYFDKEDIRTYGLCFSVKTKTQSGMFGSVMIRSEQNKNPNRLKSLERFAILYTAGLNPNSSELILFREQVKKEFLGAYLAALCKQFYEAESASDMLTQESHFHLPLKADRVQKNLYRCAHCFTVYDESIGDPDQLIAAGTGFASLPDNYCCLLCEAPKKDFEPVKEDAHLEAV